MIWRIVGKTSAWMVALVALSFGAAVVRGVWPHVHLEFMCGWTMAYLTMFLMKERPE